MTKVRTYRIDVDENARAGDAIVIANNGCMTSQHLGTSASLDNGTCPGNVPILDVEGKLGDGMMPSSTMKKCVYDPKGKNADAFDYCNFDNIPTIPVVNDPVVTFTQGGVTVGSISLNQSGSTEIGLMAGGVTSGSGIDINCNVVSVDYDNTSIGVNACDKLEVKDYSTIVSGAAAGATAVQANDLATVAMTGNYCDLINKPEIPSAQIQSDWEQCNTSLPDYIKNKPTIGNATITLQKNGTNVDCFELNQTANKCLNLTLNKCDVGLNSVDNTSDADKPISDATQCALNCKQDNITDLNTIRCNACDGKTASETISNYGDIVTHNVCEFATASQGAKADTALQCSDLNAVAFSGKYCDLSGTPTIPTDNCELGNGCGYTTCTGTLVLSDLQPYAKSCTLCTVATSGKYCDLTGQPTIPTDNCQLANSCGYTTCTGTLVSSDLTPYAKCCDLKTVATSGQYCDLSGKPTIPTDNCQLANGCGYITNAVNDLTNYYLKCETYQKCEVDNLIANFGGFEVVSTLPSTNIKTNVIYLLGPIGTGDDKYEEWIYYNNTWTKIGETTTDLSNYAKCCDIPTNNNQLSNGCGYTTCTGTLVASDLQPYAKSCDLCTIATSGKYCDLSGTPTIPTDNCQLGNGCGYTTCTGTLVANDLQPYAKTCILCTVATSGKYCDLTGTPTIPTDNCQLANSCGYTTCTGTLVSSDLQPYAKSCDLKAVATSGKYCDLTGTPSLATVATSGCYNDLSGKPSLCTVATSGKYCDLSGTPSLATVATSGCYNDLTGKPTIPTDNCQLGNSCNYITKDVTNLTCYTPTSSLATVATSGAYCDLTGKPTLACVACSGCYDDLSGKPNLGVYQTTGNLVCSLVGADNTHYPSAKAVADALSSCGAGDMLKATYDPCNKNGNAFDYNNFINTPSLCTVATSGKYCDLTGTPTIPAALNAGTGINIENNKINAQNLYVINEDAIDVTYTGELGVAPYNACYCYTNVCINPNCGVHWVEGATYIFNLDTKVSNSACRNVRLKIGNGDYIPLMGTTAIVNGNSYFVKAAIRPFQYSTKYQKCGALHVVSDSNTTYSAMSCAEGTAGTCTCARSLTAACLKAITQKHISDNAILKTSANSQTVCTTASGCTTPLGLKSNSTSSYLSFSNTSGWIGSYGVTCDKQPTFYNGTGYTLAYTSDIPTDNCQLGNSCGYITNSALSGYTKTCDLATVATSGCYCDLTGTPTIPTVNTKTFTLSSTSDTTNASAAAAYINDGNNAIILLSGQAYYLTSKSSSSMVFKSSVTSTSGTSDTELKQSTLTFTVSGNTVSAISNTATSLGKYLQTDRNYGTAYTPLYSGSPATKEYVDCAVGSINSAEWGNITGTMSCQTDLQGALNCKADCTAIPTDNCQLANSCGYTTCTGTLVASDLNCYAQCCDFISKTNTTAFTPTGDYNPATKLYVDCAVAGVGGGDMCYGDFNFVSKSGASVTLDLSSEITPSANFTVNTPSTIKEGQSYVLRVTNGATAYTMSLGSCVTNPWGVDLTLTSNGTDQFVFYAISDSELELQKEYDDENVFVTQAQYNNLPATKCTDGKTYFIYE